MADPNEIVRVFLSDIQSAFKDNFIGPPKVDRVERTFDRVMRDARAAGYELMPHQAEAVVDAALFDPHGPKGYRACLYHRTGAGKSITSLFMMDELQLASPEVSSSSSLIIIAPPITHEDWLRTAESLGLVNVTAISHSKFRQKNYKVDRRASFIVDEFHLLGGHSGMGWRKLEAVEPHLQGAIILLSATPNYNDVERCYCVQRIIDRPSTKGGYLQFIYEHCETEMNPFGAMPKVIGFRKFKNAEEYLVALPKVFYLEDEAIKQVTLVDRTVKVNVNTDDIDVWGLSHEGQSVLGSTMARSWAKKFVLYLDDKVLRDEVIETLREEIIEELDYLMGQLAGPLIIYCESARIASAAVKTLRKEEVSVGIVTGATRNSSVAVDDFLEGRVEVLVCTATIGTGFDGLDKVCDTLIFLDDTTDDAKRRQIMGRILPRGLDSDVSNKSFYRINVTNE